MNRQSERFAREGIDLGVSTLADWVGACTRRAVAAGGADRRHVLAAERIHGDDTTVPVLARGKTITGRLWTYVRDDRPFGGPAPPAAIFYYSRDRGGEHPCRHLASYAGILQADAYAGFNDLYDAARKPGPIIEAACWATGGANCSCSPMSRRRRWRSRRCAGSTRSSTSSARSTASPPSNGARSRQVRVAPLVDVLERWMRGERGKLSRHAEVAKAMDYMLKRWAAFTRFLDDGRICLTNNAAERALRGIALGRKAWLFAGSDRGGERAAAMYSLIVHRQAERRRSARLARRRARAASPITRPHASHELLPWHWPRRSEDRSLAA